jgi:hypothetical protein
MSNRMMMTGIGTPSSQSKTARPVVSIPPLFSDNPLTRFGSDDVA